MSSNPFYITTTLPYVNADPHVGFAMEIIRADTIARYKRALGYDVFFNTGTDEHGAKIYENALKEKIPAQTYVDGYASKFKELTQLLNIEDVTFIRTTDEKHVLAAQEMWKRCFDNGYIYKKTYQAKYCVGCELYKTDSELVDSKCPIHPNRDIEIIDEENYFFKFSAFQDRLKVFYQENPEFVVPDFRYNEIKAFVDRGLEDFSISRLASKMSWGVPVPGDTDHVMYVWFDALTNYISTLNWPEEGSFEKYWAQDGLETRNVIQYCGKDNLRQQSAMWQSMLMASGLPNSTKIIIDGFITSGGQKMSKSIGNVISPFDVINLFKEVTPHPEDVLRFVLLHEVPSFEDGDITIDSIKLAYNSHLAKGLGNLISRTCAMIRNYGVDIDVSLTSDVTENKKAQFYVALDNYNCKIALEVLMEWSRELDERIARDEPFKLIKVDPEKAKAILREIHGELLELVRLLKLVMPKSMEQAEGYLVASGEVKPLFIQLP